MSEICLAEKMIFGEREKVDFEYSDICWICQKGFNAIDNDEIKDHCHLTGKYRGAAHNKCNVQYKKPKFIPVVFHNLSGHDSHLFIKNLRVSNGDINCIPKNEEKYISFSNGIIVNTYTNKYGEQKYLRMRNKIYR